MDAPLLSDTPVRTAIRLDPRTKLLLLLVINTIMLAGRLDGVAIYIRPVLAAVPFVLLLSAGRAGLSLSYGILYIVAWYAENFLMESAGGTAGTLILLGSGLVSRLSSSVFMAYYLILSTQVGELSAAMGRMHVTQKVAIPFLVMFRFFPTIAEENRAINDAMRMRGIRFAGNPVSMMEYRLVPLLISIAKIGNELSAAALTKGLGNPVKRTHVCKIGFGPWDAVFGIAVIVAAACYLLF